MKCVSLPVSNALIPIAILQKPPPRKVSNFSCVLPGLFYVHSSKYTHSHPPTHTYTYISIRIYLCFYVCVFSFTQMAVNYMLF